MTVYTSSVLRTAAPFWLKINYSCYFCSCVSNSILPSRVFLFPLSLPSFTTSFLCFIPVASLASFPYLFCSFDSLYLLGFGLCSVRSSSNRSCLALVFNTCKGHLSLNEVYRKSLHTEFRREWSSWLISPVDSQKISKGQFLRKCMQCSSVFFSQAIPGVLQGYQSCCSSSPGHIKAVKAQMAAKYISELRHCWWPRLCCWLVTEYVAPLPCNTTNVTEIQTDFEESLVLTLQEKNWPLDTCG